MEYEQDTIANHERDAHPECLVRNHLRDSLSAPNLPVDDHADDDVCHDSNEKPVCSFYASKKIKIKKKVTNTECSETVEQKQTGQEQR